MSEVNESKYLFPCILETSVSISPNTPSVKTQTISRRVVLTALGRVGAALYMVGLSVGCSNEPPRPSVSLFRSLQEQDRIASLAWSPDSTHLVCGAFDSTAKIWEVATGKLSTMPLVCGDVVTSVAWSPDQTRIASGEWGNHLVRVWDAATGKPVATYQDSPRSSNCVAWSYDSRYIAVGYAGRSSADRVVKIWDTTTGKNTLTYQNDNKNVHTVAWSPTDPDLLASGTDGKNVYIQNVKTNLTILTYRGHDQVNALAWSPDGKYIASGSGDYDLGATPPAAPFGDTTVHVWDASTGKPVSIYRGHRQTVTTLAWSPNGKHIVSGSADSTVMEWDASTGQTVTSYTGHSGDIGAVAWSPDGKYIASGGVDKKILIWQAQN